MKKYLRLALWVGLFLAAIFCRGSFPSISASEYLVFTSILVLLFIVDLYVHLRPGSRFTLYIRRYAYTLLLILLILDVVKMIYYSTQYHPFEPFLQAHPYKYDLPYTKDSNEIRILCLGGSTTSNSALPDSCKYPYRLEKKLQAQFPTKKIRVLNLGMDWYTSKHMLVLYTTEAKYYHPDIVICMEAMNDMYRSFSPRGFSMGEYNDQYTHFYGPSYYGADPPTMEYFLLSRSKWGDIPFRFISKEKVKYNVSEFRSIKPYIRNLSALAEYVKADSAAFFLMTQPNLYKSEMSRDEVSHCCFGFFFCNRKMAWNKMQYPDVLSMKAAMDTFLHEERQLAALRNINLIDADQQIPKSLDFFTDDIHFNSRAADSLSSVAYYSLAKEIGKRK